MKTNPSYEQIATQLGIPRCVGCDDFDHRNGSIGAGSVHWWDRSRVERPGVRRFLKLAAMLQLTEEGETRPWARLYLAQRRINAWAKELGMTFPGRLTEHDRLLVKAMCVGVPANEPLREEAMDWALAK